MDSPLISVVVPVRERRQFLPQCLGSVVDQVHDTPLEGRVELLVQDNASPSPGMQELVVEHSRGLAKYHRNEADVGCYPSVNRAIRRSKGRWIHVLHDDDWVLPGFYARVVDAIAAHGATVAGVCTLFTVKNDLAEAGPDGSIPPDWQSPPFAPQGGVVDLVDRILDGNLFQSCAVVFRREVADWLGPFREDLPFTADWEYWARMSLRWRWCYVPAVLACYRLHQSNLTHELAASGEVASSIRRTIETLAAMVPAAKRPVLAAARVNQARHLLSSAYQALEQGMPEVTRHYLLEIAEVLKG